MNKLQILYSHPKIKKIIILISIFLVIAIPFILIKILAKPTNQTLITVPIIPPSTTIIDRPVTPLETTNPLNPTQKLIFSWGTISPQFPSTLNNYIIEKPLITFAAINSISSKFGFSLAEKSPYTDENSVLWLNDKHSLFGSPKQNQIMYNSTSTTPKHTSVITKEEATGIAQNIISDLLGNSLASTFNSSPEIKYLNHNPETEDEPVETTPEIANIVNINFQQKIDNLPFLNLSKRGETISVAIDTSKKVYLLYVYGGYSSLSQKGQSILLNFSELQELAPTKAIRISYSKDIPSESAYTESKAVNIKVDSVEVGYFQRADNDIFPVFIIKGIMSARGLDPFPAIYIVPASK